MPASSPTSGKACRPAERIFDVDFYDLPGTKDDYHQPWKDLQGRTAPHNLIWTPRNGGHWIATRAKSIREIISDPERFSSYRMSIPPGTDRTQRWDVLPISLDPPEHGPYRAVLNSGLSPRAVNARAKEIRELAISLVDSIRPLGACEFVKDYAEEFSIRLLFLIMDLPFSDKPEMMRIIGALVSPDGSMTVGEVIAAFGAYLAPVIEERTEKAGADLISQICNGTIGDRRLTRQEAVQMCVQTFAAGLESVRNALSFIMLRLALDPDTRRKLRDRETSLQRAIDEFLRRYGAMMMAREVVADMVYDGVELFKGDLISCPVHLAGLDELQNPDPMDLKLDREAIGSVAFGGGPHFCAGRWLANLEIKVTIEEWLACIPDFSVAPDARITYSSGLLGGVDALPLVWEELAPGTLGNR